MVSRSIKKPNRTIILLFSMLVVAVLIQCQATDDKPNSTGEPINLSTPIGETPSTSSMAYDKPTVTIRFACDNWQASGYEELAEVFHQLNPDIEVEIITFEDDIPEFSSSDFDHTLATYQIVSSADTASWTVTPIVAQQGLIRDLGPFIEATARFERQDFHPGMLELFEWDSGVWALPAEPTYLWLITYDKRAFDAAGLVYPQPGWSYEEFLNAAQELTVRDGDSVVQYGFADLAMVAPYTFIAGQLPTLAAGEFDLASIDLHEEEVIAAVQWYIDLVNKYGVMPDFTESIGDSPDRQRELFELVESGRVAMWTQRVSVVARTEAEANIGLAPFPSEEQKTNPLFASGYIVSPGTRYPMESWRWINFLTHQDLGDAIKLPPAITIPTRRSVATGTDYWARWNRDSIDVIQYALEHALPLPYHPEVQRSLQRAVTEALSGRRVEEALVEANERLAEIALAHTQATPMPSITVPHTQNQPRTAENGSIVFVPQGFDVALYRPLARQFQEEYSTVVQVDLPHKDTSPDCLVGVLSIDKDIERMNLLNLQPFVDTDPEFDVSDFHPRALNAFRARGDLWGIPMQTKMLAIFYNQDLFDRAMVPYPKAGWTLEDFVTYATKLTQGQDTEKQYGYLHLNGDYADLQVFTSLHGARLWDEMGQPRFDSPDVVAAVKWYADLEQKNGVAPSFIESYPSHDRKIQEIRNAFVRNNQVAMWTDFVGTHYDATYWPDAKIGVAPIPLGKTGGVTLFLDEGFFVRTSATDPAKCWEWLKFVNSHERISSGLPVRRSVFTSASFISRMDQDVLDVYSTMMNYAPVSTSPETATDDLVWLFQALNEIRNGKSPDEALREAQMQATK